MVVRIISGFLALAILILINKNEHDGTDDREGYNGNSHRNPKKRVCPLAVIGSNGQIIILEVSKRVPEESHKAYDHKNHEQRGIYLVCRTSFFIPGTLCYGY